MKRRSRFLPGLTVACAVIIAFTGFSVRKKFEYTIKVNFSEFPTTFKDTAKSGPFSDCPSTMQIQALRAFSYWDFDKFTVPKKSEIVLIKSDKTDTIKKHLCLVEFKEDYFYRLSGDYVLRCASGNKIFKPFEKTINIDPKRDKGRAITIIIGNYAAQYIYKVTSQQRLSLKEQELLKDFYLVNEIDRDEGYFVPASASEFDAPYNFVYTKQCSIKLVERKIKLQQ